MALVAFAFCLLIGGFAADNPFGTTLARALVAMAATFPVAWVVGVMAEKMLEENLHPAPTKSDETLPDEIKHQ
jgi:hypothetical protein